MSNTTTKPQLNEKQQYAYNQIMSGKNVFMTGDAGVGKSFVLQQVIKDLGRDKVFVAAPTGIAALNVDGITIHRLFGLRTNINLFQAPTGKQLKRFKSLFDQKHHILIIDEISMCSSALFSYVMAGIAKVEQMKGIHIQVILVGDFSQLPPVVRRGSMEERQMISQFNGVFAFQTPAWTKLNLETIVLTDIVRQNNPEFTKALNEIRSGNTDGLKYINAKSNDSELSEAITLCGTNKKAKSINQTKLAQVNNKSYFFNAYESPSFPQNSIPTDENMELKVGTRVMTIKNGIDDQGFEYYNGSLGKIVNIKTQGFFTNKTRIMAPSSVDSTSDYDDGPIISIQLDDGPLIHVTWAKWDIYNYSKDSQGRLKKYLVGTYIQLPIKLAYAITIHKSQGQTYDRVNFDPQIFAEGQLYVGLSRVRSIDGLHLLKPLNDRMVKTATPVNEFYRDMATPHEETTEEPHSDSNAN